MKHLLLGALLVLGLHAVVKRAAQLPPGQWRRGAIFLTQAAAILSPRLARLLAGAWQLHAWQKANAAQAAGTLGLAEAERILGIGRDAGREAINARYRHLMRRHHPDQGGSAEAASRINAARDRLLAEAGD